MQNESFNHYQQKNLAIVIGCIGLLVACPETNEPVFITKFLAEDLPIEMKSQLNLSILPEKLTIMKLDVNNNGDDEIFIQINDKDNYSIWTVFHLKQGKYRKYQEDIALQKNYQKKIFWKLLIKVLVIFLPVKQTECSEGIISRHRRYYSPIANQFS